MAALTGAYGTERRLLNHLASEHRSKHIRHFLCVLRVNPTLLKELESVGVPFIVNNLRGIRNIGEFISFVKKHKIDILHSHNLIGHSFRNRILPKIAGIPYIIEHEGGMVWDLNFSWGVKITNSLVTVNISNSEAGKALLQKKCGISAHVIPNGVNLSPVVNNASHTAAIYTSLGLCSPKKLVGFVGRLDTPKGVHAFLQSIPLIKQAVPNAAFVAVGDGPMREELQEYAAQLQISPLDLHWLGYRNDVRQLMAAFDVLVMPSIREPFPNVLLEASAAKIPVVASSVDGIPEIVIDGETGILIDCNTPVIPPKHKKAKELPCIVVDGKTRRIRPPFLPNPEKLAESVIYLLNNEEVAARMGENAAVSVLSRFSFQRYVRSLDELYLDVEHWRDQHV